MIAVEMKSAAAVVRIHDEHCVSEPQGCRRQLDLILSEARRRRGAPRPAPR